MSCRPSFVAFTQPSDTYQTCASNNICNYLSWGCVVTNFPAHSYEGKGTILISNSDCAPFSTHAEKSVVQAMSSRACKQRLKWPSEQHVEQHADSRQANSVLHLCATTANFLPALCSTISLCHASSQPHCPKDHAALTQTAPGLDFANVLHVRQALYPYSAQTVQVAY